MTEELPVTSLLKLEDGIPNIIVAFTDKNKFIGKDNDLPWKRALKGDLQFLNKLIRTRPNVALLMGRATYLSMPRKTGFVEIVLSRSKAPLQNSPVMCGSFEEALEYCKENELCVVVFGGEEVYKQALNHKSRVFCTVVSEEGTDLTGDRIYPGGWDSFKNITNEVSELLKDSKHDWILKDDSFVENGYIYKFYTGYV